jgi:hypothetical protein
MGCAGKQVIQKGSDEDDIPLAQRKRKVDTTSQGPRGRGRLNRPAGPRRSTGQGHRACTKQAHQPDEHYDDYEDISLDSLSTFVLRPSRPPHPATQMGILKKVDYTRGSHNMYKKRYTDPALWQKEFDADICFWLKFNAHWYESVILSKEHMTIEMKSIMWDNLRSLSIPAVNEAIDICHAKGLTSIMGLNYDWNERSLLNFMPISMSGMRQRPFIGFCKESLSLSPMKNLLKYLALVRRISVVLSFMVVRYC